VTAERHPEEFEQPALPAYSEDGVDLTLIREMLALSPAERLRRLQEFVESVGRLRDAAEQARLARSLGHSG
jgi:hypothetical protein